MILAIDVGNTNIIIGVIDAKKTYFVERITTTIGKPNLEYAVALKSILEIYHIAPDQLDGAIVSSVVPPLNRTILAAIRKITGLNAMLVGSGMKTGLNILMDNPKSVGSDMIVNAVGALAEHEPPIIIIEMGTATTMSVIDKNGRYVGGAILPGFDFGNSPSQTRGAEFRGKPLLHTTSAGTQGLAAAAGAAEISLLPSTPARSRRVPRPDPSVSRSITSFSESRKNSERKLPSSPPAASPRLSCRSVRIRSRMMGRC